MLEIHAKISFVELLRKSTIYIHSQIDASNWSLTCNGIHDDQRSCHKTIENFIEKGVGRELKLTLYVKITVHLTIFVKYSCCQIRSDSSKVVLSL